MTPPCYLTPYEIDALVQDVFAEHGPEAERLCEWRKSLEEPWRSLARVLP